MAEHALLQLVARGHSIVAEIRRLSGFVPAEISQASQHRGGKLTNPVEELLVDFRYLRDPDSIEKQWLKSENIIDPLDQDFRERWLGLVERFYALWDSIYKYWKDLDRFLTDLERGIFVQQSLETLLASVDSTQLVAEALYLYGVILLVLEQRISGGIRERLLVLYQRWLNVHLAHSNFDRVCKLCAETHSSSAQFYPEDYFQRFPLPSAVVEMVLAKLRSDDIFRQVPYYPLPDHRSTALGNQASMIYVLLYFVPHILQKDHAKMREIVDRFHPDNWVLSVYLGPPIDLSVHWKKYPAARDAIKHTISSESVKRCTDSHCDKMKVVMQELAEFMSEGVMTKEYVLDHIRKLLYALRDSNVSFRWLLLHSNAQNVSLRSSVTQLMEQRGGPVGTTLLQLLLLLSQFEFKLKRIVRTLFQEKLTQWKEYQRQACERMDELAEYFSGEKPLTRVQKNESLQAWFGNVSRQIRLLNFEDVTANGRKIVQLQQALDEIEQFHQMSTHQIKSFLADTRGFLNHLLLLLNIKEDVLATIDLVSDASYAWELMPQYIKPMQDIIEKNPNVVAQIRTVFLRMSSIMDLPLMRINQAASPDLVSVSQYYSGELVQYIQQVLQVVPRCTFDLLTKVIKLHTETLREFPTKLEKIRLADSLQLKERFELSSLTTSISEFTAGILAMNKTLVGVVEVDPKSLLENGIRLELSQRIQQILETTFVFSERTRTTKQVEDKANTELEEKLLYIFLVLRGFHRSFEDIQDHLCVYALQIWQEEFSSILRNSVELEADRYRQGAEQSDPRPRGFMGRIAQELIRLTSPRHAIFHPDVNAWYLRKGYQPIINERTIRHIVTALGPNGIVGIHRLLGFHIVGEYRTLLALLRQQFQRGNPMLATCANIERELRPLDTIPPNFAKLYPAIESKFSYIGKSFAQLVCSIGHLHSLRIACHAEWKTWRVTESRLYDYTIETANLAATRLVRERFADMHQFDFFVREYKDLFSKLDEMSHGESSLQTVFPVEMDDEELRQQQKIPLFLFLVLLPQLGKFTRHPVADILECKGKGENLDFQYLIYGTLSLFQQLDPIYTQTYTRLWMQYIRSCVNACGQVPLTPTFRHAVWMLRELGQRSKLFSTVLDELVPILQWIADE